MADEEIPENVDLRFLAEQQTRFLRELAHMRQDDQARDVAIAALSVDLKITKEGVEEPIRAAADGRRAAQYYRRPACKDREAHRLGEGVKRGLGSMLQDRTAEANSALGIVPPIVPSAAVIGRKPPKRPESLYCQRTADRRPANSRG